jgi:hypothetical protein
MPRGKFSAAVYLFLVFVSGAVVGAVAHRLYMVNTVQSVAPGPRRPNPAEWRKHIIEEMHTRVKLDDQQMASLQHIFDETDATFSDLHAKRKPEDQRRLAENQAVQSQMVDKINAILREDQKPLYQQYRAEREAEREKDRKRRQDGDNRKQ